MTEPTPDASTGAPANQAVDEHDLLVLARIAGLPVSDDRAAGLARELTTTLAAARELDAVLVNRPLHSLPTSLAFGPYDPAWSDEAASGSGAVR